MTRPLDIVIDFLRQQEARGINHVDLDESARAFLNQLSKTKGSASVSHSHATADRPIAALQQSQPNAPEPLAPVSLQTVGNTKAEKLADLRRQLITFPQARGLKQLRQTLVFSQGNPDARIVFVGESPSHYDEQQGHPFAGGVSEKFDAILKAMNLSRAEVYLTYLVKFRPAMKNQTTNNRVPVAAEVAEFIPVLAHEMNIVRPEVIVSLGSIASQALCASHETIDSLRGRWHQWEGTSLRVSESPSFLITASLHKKRKFWEDMLSVMEKLSMPISEKQRSYFLSK